MEIALTIMGAALVGLVAQNLTVALTAESSAYKK
jgi:hypothetical protein